MNVAHLTFVILLLFLPLFEIHWLHALLQVILSEMRDSGNAFGLSFGHEIFPWGSSCNGQSPSGLLLAWHAIAKTFVIVKAAVATDSLSCDARGTLGTMDSAAWELGPKKLEAA